MVGVIQLSYNWLPKGAAHKSTFQSFFFLYLAKSKKHHRKLIMSSDYELGAISSRCVGDRISHCFTLAQPKELSLLSSFKRFPNLVANWHDQCYLTAISSISSLYKHIPFRPPAGLPLMMTTAIGSENRLVPTNRAIVFQNRKMCKIAKSVKV